MPKIPTAQSSSVLAEHHRVVARWQARGVPEYLRPVVVPYVKSCVLDAGPVSGRRTNDRLSACAKLVEFSIDAHMNLDRELIFDPANIESLTEALNATMPITAAKYRSELRDMGPMLTRHAPRPTKVTRIPRTALAAPYTDVEWHRLEAISHRQSTPIKARIFQTTIALSLGAGLDGRWICRVKVDDFRELGRRLCIEVAGPSPRTIPVRKRYQTTLRHLAANIPSGSYLLTGSPEPSNKNYLSQSLSDLDIPRGTPALHAGRARSTWLLQHLLNGARLDVLAQAAGFQGTATLADLLPFMPPMPPSRACALLAE